MSFRLSQRENVKLSWLSYLVLMTQVELLIPWWLGNRLFFLDFFPNCVACPGCDLMYNAFPRVGQHFSRLPSGALDPLAIELAKSQSLAVDFPKTGVLPSVPKDTLDRVKSNGFPDFMQKPGADALIFYGLNLSFRSFSLFRAASASKDTYTSEKILGMLFRRCISLDADFEMSASLDLDPQLLLPQRHEWKKGAREAQGTKPRKGHGSGFGS